MSYNIGVRVTSAMPDYTGYAFAWGNNSDEGKEGDLKYGILMPHVLEEKWRDKTKGGEGEKESLLMLLILRKVPQFGKPFFDSPYDANQSWLLSADEENLRKRKVTPIGKFTIDDQGKRYPWVPGKNSKLLPLDETEKSLTAIDLIRKSAENYFNALDAFEGDTYEVVTFDT